MEKKLEITPFTNGSDILLLLIKWWKPIVITAVLATVLSSIFSGAPFIKPKYKSTVILYPATTNSVSYALLNEDGVYKGDMLAFGEEEQTEQLLQMLKSDEIRDQIIEKYDLMKHYEINPDSEYPHTKLHRIFEDNVSFKRTEYMSVKIEVLDTDAQIAADMANDIAAEADILKNKIQKTRSIKALNIIKTEYEHQQKLVQKLEDSLTYLRGKGIYDYKSQAEILSSEYTRSNVIFNDEKAKLPVFQKNYPTSDTLVIKTIARIEGAKAVIKDIELKLDLMTNYGGIYMSLSELLWQERAQLGFLKKKYEKARIDVEETLPSTFVVNKAAKAEKKSYPVRWLIVILSVLSSVLFAALIVIMIENFGKLKSRQPSIT